MVSLLGLRKSFNPPHLPSFLALSYMLTLSGCFSVNVGGIDVNNNERISSFISESLTGQRDPLLVYEALPNYLLLIDKAIDNDPDNGQLLIAGSDLYILYSLFFEDNPKRNTQLTHFALAYADRSLCLAIIDLCNPSEINYQDFIIQLQATNIDDIDILYSYSLASLSYIKASGADWRGIAFLPWIQKMLERIVELDDTYKKGSAYAYLGILNGLRPPALGGNIHLSEAYFLKAISYSEEKNLYAKVDYARYVAMTLFDQDLHDRLLNEVIDAHVDDVDFNLFNNLAKQHAALLLEQSENYFN